MKRVTIAGILIATLAAAMAIAATGYRTAKITSYKPRWWRAQAAYPVFAGRSEVERAASRGYQAEARSLVAGFLRDARQYNKTAPRYQMEYDAKPVISIVNLNLVSGYYMVFADTGGAHPNTIYYTLNYGLVNGKPARLKFANIMARNIDRNKFVNAVILPELNNMKKARGMDPVDTLDKGLEEDFIVTRSGITWIFSPYAVGAYVEGTYMVKIPWDELAGWINPNGPLKDLIK